ncbi:MAG: tyrosine-type recombinase/integrase [Opitutaceae bacterium]
MRIKTRADNGYKYVRVGGRRISLKTRSDKEARQMVKDLNLEQIEHASKAGDAGRRTIPTLIAGHGMTLAKAVDEWAEWADTVGQSALTIRRNRIILSSWLADADLEGRAPGEVAEKEINAFINAKGKAGAKTRERQLSAIRSLYAFMAAKGYIHGNPSRLVVVDLRRLSHDQREPKKVRPYTPEEIQRLLTGLDGFWRAVAGISYATALRLGDVIQLEWASIKPNTIVVWTEKRDRRVSLPITPELRAALAAVPLADGPYLFPEEREELQDVSKRSKFSVYFKRELNRLGLEGLTFHGLRHTRISQWRKDGFSLEDCRIFAGHNSQAATARYLHLGLDAESI